MSFGQLLWRNLVHHRRAHLGVALGVAVATAVLTGALLIGDSLRGSLRALAEDRLGNIDLALVGDQFFPEDLAKRWQEASPALGRIARVIVLQGTVLTRDAQDRVAARVGRVQILGVDDEFWSLFDHHPAKLGTDYLVNAALADDLGIAVGSTIEVRIEKPQAVPADSILAERHEPEGVYLEPSRVAAVLANHGPGQFTLAMQQAKPRILYVALRRLQQRLERDANQLPGGANVLLAEVRAPSVGDGLAAARTSLQSVLRLEDVGLQLRASTADPHTLVIETRRMLLEPAVVDTVLAAARANDWQCQPVMTYLANVIYRTPGAQHDLAAALAENLASRNPGSLLRLAAAGSAYTPYSAVAGIDPAKLVAGSEPHAPPSLKDDEILLSEVVARDLWPRGDWQAERDKPSIALQYFVEGDGYHLKVQTATLKLAGVYPTRGAVADRTLTPEFPGLKTRIQDWKPPFPREQWHPQWVRDVDERYYREFRVAPKAFVSPGLAHQLWSSRFGAFTSLRLRAPNLTAVELDNKCRQQLQAFVAAAGRGLSLLAVKDQGRQASGSGTANMFGGLFVGFSWFLIVAAALLVGLLFRLGIERRAGELGLYHALGLPPRWVTRLFLSEGAMVSLVGCVLGITAGMGYAWILIQSLRWGWRGGLDGSVLQLHVAASEPTMPGLPYPSLTLGFVIGLGIALLTVAWSLRGIATLAPAALLAQRGWIPDPPAGSAHRRPWIVLAVAAVIAVLTLVGGAMVPPAQAGGWFFGAGMALLVAGLAALSLVLRRPRSFLTAGSGRAALTWLGVSNAARNPGRSLLTAGLLACALFLIIAVDAFRKSSLGETERGSGTGGFTLLAEADIPLPSIPRDAAAAKEILSALPELADRTVSAWPEGARVFGCRLRPGDDVSCMNLYQPRRPRILGVSTALIERGGFSFHMPADASPAERANPWLLLNRPADQGIPVLADDHTAQWVLQKGIGDTIIVPGDDGRDLTLHLVGMFQSSLFQSELLMGESEFKTAFPNRGGYAFFLVDVAPNQADAYRRIMNEWFGEAFGLQAIDARDRLAAFQSVENTYISTFQALGGLGLLLGTIGLGVVLLRNLNERLAELALLRAIGFRESALRWLILAENAGLIVAGLAIGCMAAVLAVFPAVVGGQGALPVGTLLALAVLIPAVGLGASAAALRGIMRTDVIPALRRE